MISALPQQQRSPRQPAETVPAAGRIDGGGGASAAEGAGETGAASDILEGAPDLALLLRGLNALLADEPDLAQELAQFFPASCRTVGGHVLTIV